MALLLLLLLYGSISPWQPRGSVPQSCLVLLLPLARRWLWSSAVYQIGGAGTRPFRPSCLAAGPPCDSLPQVVGATSAMQQQVRWVT